MTSTTSAWKEFYPSYKALVDEEKRLARQSILTQLAQSMDGYAITNEDDYLLAVGLRERLTETIHDYLRRYGRPVPLTL